MPPAPLPRQADAATTQTQWPVELVHHDRRTAARVKLLECAPHDRFRDERAFGVRWLGARSVGLAFGIDALLRRLPTPLVALQVDEHADEPGFGVLARTAGNRSRRPG